MLWWTLFVDLRCNSAVTAALILVEHLKDLLHQSLPEAKRKYYRLTSSYSKPFSIKFSYAMLCIRRNIFVFTFITKFSNNVSTIIWLIFCHNIAIIRIVAKIIATPQSENWNLKLKKMKIAVSPKIWCLVWLKYEEFNGDIHSFCLRAEVSFFIVIFFQKIKIVR